MRIALDARLAHYRTGGIASYTRSLASALAVVHRRGTLLTLQHRADTAPLVAAANIRRWTLLTPPHHRLEALSLATELLRLPADIIHFPDFIAPRLVRMPTVITIHDLAFLRFPEILDAAARAYYGQVRASIQHATAVIAVSEATRLDLVELLGIDPARVDLVYEAADPRYTPLNLPIGQQRSMGNTTITSARFMLFASTIEPRKNLPTLLHALRICLDRNPTRAYRLVIAGARGWRDEAVFDTLRDLRLRDYVDVVGRVSDDELHWLYTACRFYLNPSRYEGFGLPLLEAMACGTACVAANSSSLPEIGGNAAIYLPVDDPAAWADQIEQLWQDEQQCQELGQRGIQRAAQFSWERAARETLAVYRRSIAG